MGGTKGPGGAPSTFNVPEPLSVTGKWTSQAVGRSWTLAGQQKWNSLSKTIRSAWGTSDKLEVEDGGRMGATSVFKKRFTSRWMSLHHGVVPGVKSVPKKHEDSVQDDDDDDIDGFGEPSVEAMDLLTDCATGRPKQIVRQEDKVSTRDPQGFCTDDDGKILSEDLDAGNY